MAGVFEREEERCEEAVRGGGPDSAQAESKSSTQQSDARTSEGLYGGGPVRARGRKGRAPRARGRAERREEAALQRCATLGAGLQIGSDSYSQIAASL